MIKTEEAVAINASTTAERIAEVTNKTAVVDTAIAVAATTVIKNKLKVIHINELETSPELNADQVASSVTHPSNHFRVGFINIHPSNTSNTTQHEYVGLKIPFTN